MAKRPPAAQTAFGPMVIAAAEQYVPEAQRLVDDDLAVQFLPLNLRLLGSIGFTTELTKPGSRTVYYRVDEDAWEKVVRRQVASLTSFGEIMQDGVALVGASEARGARVRARPRRSHGPAPPQHRECCALRASPRRHCRLGRSRR